MTPKSDNHRFFISVQNHEAGVCWTRFAIFNRFDSDTGFSAPRRSYSL